MKHPKSDRPLVGAARTRLVARLAIATASACLATSPSRAETIEFGMDALTVLPRGELNENLDPASAFSYGIGLGLQIELGDPNVFFETKFRYTRGDDATYLTRGSLNDRNLADRLRESSTDAWSLHIGLSFRL